MNDDRIAQLTRMIKLLKLLEISERSISNLALEVGISGRTIMRYIDVLRAVGFCVVKNNLNEYTLLNAYGVPRLNLTKSEVESLIVTCAEYYSHCSLVPSIIVETALFKIAESKSPSMVSFLKWKLHFDEDEVISNMFGQKDTRLSSNTAWCL